LTADGSFLIDIDDQVQDLLKVARGPIATVDRHPSTSSKHDSFQKILTSTRAMAFCFSYGTRPFSAQAVAA
jgi:hypothetical protein